MHWQAMLTTPCSTEDEDTYLDVDAGSSVVEPRGLIAGHRPLGLPQDALPRAIHNSIKKQSVFFGKRNGFNYVRRPQKDYITLNMIREIKSIKWQSQARKR